MNSKALIGLVAAVVLVGGGIWYLGQGSDTPIDNMTGAVGMDDMNMGSTTTDVASSTTATTTTTGTTASSTTTTGTVKTITVTGKNFSFDPTTITVNKGDRVKIVFKNSGGMHDFKIDEFNVATPKINGGAEATVEFVADKAGSFEYYCSVGNHRAMGMKGTLVVK